MTFSSPTPRSSTRSARAGRFVVTSTGTGASRAVTRRPISAARRDRLDVLISELDTVAKEKERREQRFRFWRR